MDYLNPEDHKDKLIADFTRKWKAKYDKGQEEHGGRLWRKNCREFLEEEVLDFVSYVGVLLPQLDEVERLLESALRLIPKENSAAAVRVSRALNILCVGNPEGEEEEEL